ncbi:UDP-galactose-lipid carrier transferase [Rossellomorea aquimaris]|uniref:UDP-galactose-lipid carrier transferase n=1 Tax=Rossellomorea aquimaris TaxID=189382 RepID=A0A5D4TTE1_9BACI|nr:UDP-galactose-lipid carrier transferase [Rossellomorea aquimaris]TYS78081.1 UDP-galactose-lipid carrier transferase [Rossellomorea aquimaris]
MLDSVDLTRKIDDKKEYEKRLKKQQLILLGLQRALMDEKIGCILVFEGWDAAGKGGAIKRTTQNIDPRGFEVHSTAAPTLEQKQYHYLQRFWNRMPKYGKLGIFDRSWYGRVLVERVEGFAEESEWRRAYGEINDFERILTGENYIVLKFWFHISKEEQLNRFNDRQNDPMKSWKLTEEDWRNREKWDLYKEAVDEMIQETDKENAPWHIIEGEDKKHARVKTLEIINRTILTEMEKRKIDVRHYFKKEE